VSAVTIYTKESCSPCAHAKALLRRKGVVFQEIDVSSDPAREREMIERSGGRRTAPQIFIGAFHVGGHDDLVALDHAGRLDPLLFGGSEIAAGAAAAAGAVTAPERQPGRGMGMEEAHPSFHEAAAPLQRARGAGEQVHDVVIVGSGPAGLTAAIYAARANLKPVVVEGLLAGGQLMQTTEVENYPGFPEGILGPELMERFRGQAARFGTTFVAGDVVRLDLSSRPFTVATDETTLKSRALILATGASPRYLEIPGEKEYAGRGVSYCATCDGFFFRDQEILVVGGGDTAMEEALFLTRYGSRVTIVHRRDKFRASKVMADRVLAHPKVEVLWETTLEEVVGDGTKVLSARVRHLKTGRLEERPVSGLFVAIGHVPNTAVLQGALPTDGIGYLRLLGHGTSHTAIDGVFAAGDVHDHVYRQAVTAAGTGCRAAIDAERWLEAQGR
jgi:thioredoxin reductase (NADPH)